MQQRKFGILSLDVSAASTGWCFLVRTNMHDYGIIKTSPKKGRAERLFKFKKEITKLLEKYNPSFVVIENGYFGRNVKTLKVLCEFAGVAKVCCMEVSGIEPFVMNVNTPKSYFKAKTKEDVFNCMVGLYGLDGFEFKKDNDVTDSLCQAVCFYETEVKKGKDK